MTNRKLKSMFYGMPAQLESVLPSTWSHDNWREGAACRLLGNQIFFPVGYEPAALAQTRQAKSICSSCPVRFECLEFALRTAQEDGVWGGHTEDERRAIRRSRRAARRRALAS